MGVGHVPAGSFRQDRQGDDVPRRQYRRARAHLGAVDADLSRKALGSLGERIAAQFLVDRGARILARNERVGRGEIDLIVDLAGVRIAVEVKTGTGQVDPICHFDDAKAAQVRALAARCGIRRVDYVGVSLSGEGVTVRWLPEAG